MTSRKTGTDPYTLLSLTRFREKITAARRRAGYLQKDLASALGLDSHMLSHKLHGSDGALLSHQEVKQIIRTLAAWDAITTRSEAIELLTLMQLRSDSFSAEDWDCFPLDRLEAPPNNHVVPKVIAELSPTSWADRARPQLPEPLTPLIGREKTIQQVCEQLRREGVRLVNLLGTAGVGKTRMALAVARQMREGFADGVHFVPLAVIHDPNLVASATAEALHLLEESSMGMSRSPEDLLKYFFHEKDLLLVLDNFEQVLAATTMITEILEAAPGVKILVTSRAVLHLYGEYQFWVPPLEVAAPDTPPEHEMPAAIRLFVERAQATDVRFTLTAQNMPTVAAICTRLDGLPLAIELAAARTRLLSPAMLLEQLEGRHQEGLLQKPGQVLALLLHQMGNVPVRQQTLWNTLDWSYRLLEEDEQRLFVQLGVFQGGWTLEAMQAVCLPGENHPQPGVPVDTSSARLERLVDQSLVLPMSSRDQNAKSMLHCRFSLLETVREYARARLYEVNEWAEVHRRHAAYYLRFVQRAEEEVLRSANPGRAMQRLEQEQDNVRAALQWAIEQEEPEEAQQLCSAFSAFWERHNQPKEGRRWIDAALRLGDHTSLSVRAKLVLAEGKLTLLERVNEQAGALFQKSLALYEASGDLPGKASALYYLGDAYYFQEDYAHAADHYMACLELYQALDDSMGYANALGRLGAISLFQGNLEIAEMRLKESVRLLRKDEYLHSLYTMLALLCIVDLLQERSLQALESIRQALMIVQEVGPAVDIAITLAACGCMLGEIGAPVDAALIYSATEALFERLGTTIPAIYLPFYNASLEKSRVQMTKECWESSWVRGRSLSQEQAIKLFVNVCEPLLHGPEPLKLTLGEE